MAAEHPRTIVLGLDGLDARMVASLMKAGELPNMRRLADGHGLRQIISTTPAESGVAWTCFARGTNPGYTNLFDFVGRHPGSYLPHLAGVDWSEQPVPPGPTARGLLTAGAGGAGAVGGILTTRKFTRRQWLRMTAGLGAATAGAVGAGWPLLRWWPGHCDSARSTIQGQPWWDRLAHLGERSVILRMPLTYPARAEDGVDLLAGLGTPAIDGTQGKYLILTDQPRDNGSRDIAIVWDGSSHARIQIPGPDAPGAGESKPASAMLQLDRLDANRLRITTAESVEELRRGEWSSRLGLSFSFSPLVHRRGLARLFFHPSGNGIRLYLTPIELAPDDTWNAGPISWPIAFASQLQSQLGAYPTIGWETQTTALVDGVMDEQTYLVDALAVIDLNENLLFSQLQRKDWNQLMLVVQATDQISHVLWDDAAVAMQRGAVVDPEHPLVQVYRRADQLVGDVESFASSENCRLVVMSDHGFAPFRRSVNLNTWLAQRGWLALKDRQRWDGASASAVLSGPAWANVDWFNTRAYALGLSGIYLNVAGREPEGIVQSTGEYEFLQERLQADLLSLIDPASGNPVFANVYRRQDIYDGPYVDEAPDLVVGLNEGFRISSSTVVGGIPEELLADNESRWCGDHCGIDAPQIPGICVSNFPNNWPEAVAIQSLADRVWPRS